MFKILVLKNPQITNKQVDEMVENMEEYFSEDAPRRLGSKEREFEFAYMDVNVPIKMKSYGNNNKGQAAWGADDVKRHIRALVPRNTYHCVYFCYEPGDIEHSGNGFSYVAPFRYGTPLFDETQMVQMPVKRMDDNAPTHEWMHAEKGVYQFMGIPVSDQMDKSYVDADGDGDKEWVSYFKNNKPKSEGGNYDITFSSYDPHLEKIYGDMSLNHNPAAVKESILAALRAKLAALAISQKKYPTLRVGSRGPSVKTLQIKLGVTVDGIFGRLTGHAVRMFQRNNNLVADGIVGKKTWSKLI